MTETARSISPKTEEAISISPETEESNSTDSDMQTSSEDEGAAVYQFKITLKHIRPPIWRRILILNNSTFAELHAAVIGSMGWLDSHLHAFHARGLEIAPAEEGEEHDSDLLDFFKFLGNARRPRKLDESKVKISEHFKKPKDSIKYVYDFGDNWVHGIVLEKILPYDTRPYPICIAGKRACPPDDCGGVHGYERLLRILSDPNDTEHQDMKEWMSDMGKEDFDPEAFDPDSVSFCVIM